MTRAENSGSEVCDTCHEVLVRQRGQTLQQWLNELGAFRRHHDHSTRPNWDLTSQVVPMDHEIVERLEADGYCLLKVIEGKVVIVVEPDHYVTFTTTGWFIEHSLNCRMGGKMGECPYHASIDEVADDMTGMGDHGLGRWKITGIDLEGLPHLEATGE